MIYCFDTNTCIYFLARRYPSLLKKIMSLDPDDIKIPSIVKAELIHGVEKSSWYIENKAKIDSFLLPCEIIPFDSNSADYYGKTKAYLEKNGSMIGPNDLIIAATVLSINATLVTNNINEFKRVEGLLLENWI